MGRSRQTPVTPLQIRNNINNIIVYYKHHQYLSPGEVTRAKLNSYHQGNFHYQNKKANSDYNTILLLIRKRCQLIICHDTHPNYVKK